jgi:hypothetical protein
MQKVRQLVLNVIMRMMVDWSIGGMNTTACMLGISVRSTIGRGMGSGGSAKQSTVCLLPMLVGMCDVHYCTCRVVQFMSLVGAVRVCMEA